MPQIDRDFSVAGYRSEGGWASRFSTSLGKTFRLDQESSQQTFADALGLAQMPSIPWVFDMWNGGCLIESSGSKSSFANYLAGDEANIA